MTRTPGALSIHAWLRWDAVERVLPRDGVFSALEIGAGLGSFGAMLARRFDYVGLEPDELSHRTANVRTAGRVLRSRVEEHGGVYDLVCAFEVLEHIEHDVAALRLWRERTRRWLLLSVPLGPSRYGPTDVHAGHFRRYTRESLAATLREAGFLPERLVSYGFPAGYALEAVRNRIVSRRSAAETMEDRTAASGRWLQPPSALRGVTWASALPLRLAQRPFSAGARGTGLVALASRAS